MYGKDQKCSRKPSGLFFLLLLTSFFSLLLLVQIMRVYMRSSVGILISNSLLFPNASLAGSAFGFLSGFVFFAFKFQIMQV